MTIQKLSKEATFLINYLNLPGASGDENAQWEVFQLKHLNNLSMLAIELKSRQIGWSWLAAAGSVAKSHLNDRNTCVFLSINQEEASEKIRYAKYIHEALDKEVQRKIIIDNRFEIEFDNGSRIISHPCRPLRGKAKVDLYLDEFAHYPTDREIYQSALPVISRGGSIRIGSSPLGARGRFWEIYTESMQKYPGYVRNSIPWWSITTFCNNIPEARKKAPFLSTAERVYKYGTERIITIFENSVLDDFQQEYECYWLDESISWIDWELIKRNQTLAQQQKLWYRMAEGVDQGYEIIQAMLKAIYYGHVESVLLAGVDVGRRKDKSEIVILGKSNLNQLPFRANISLDRVEFDQQEQFLDYLLENLPIASMKIDETGIGMQLAENLLRKHGAKVSPATFTNASKQLWAVEAKLRCQRGEVPLPLERDLTYQIHSIKKIVSDSSNTVQIDNDRKEGHHADKFWAWALAIYAGNEDFDSFGVETGTSLSNYRG